MEHLAHPTPLLTLKKQFKKKPAFKRYHSNRYIRVKESWRKPRGLDNRCRKKYNGTPVMPNKRFIKPAVIRNVLPNGFREVNVCNLNDLRALASLNRRYCATIHHAVSARSRVALVNEARLLGITVTNEKARLMEAVQE